MYAACIQCDGVIAGIKSSSKQKRSTLDQKYRSFFVYQVLPVVTAVCIRTMR